ncbi:hypothetical protein QTH87_25615 [Variovorax sp. J22P168]|uniref:hypothetical protein n=1 Tax=Variovorax jilinensis TaxID=3053513 RepID=UPI002575BA17|nr:hypothetical protein [Variovorax sp. J22P168]MDM0015843.1 hypothetical protein [Variovorax sp. J22P168]
MMNMHSTHQSTSALGAFAASLVARFKGRLALGAADGASFGEAVRGNVCVPVWRGEWTMACDGTHETRAFVRPSGSKYQAGFEVSFQGGEPCECIDERECFLIEDAVVVARLSEREWHWKR